MGRTGGVRNLTPVSSLKTVRPGFLLRLGHHIERKEIAWENCFTVVQKGTLEQGEMKGGEKIPRRGHLVALRS